MSPVTNRSKKRLIFVFVVISLLCTAMTFRVGWIQVVASDKYSKIAAATQTKDTPIPAKRGSIYDRNGNELAVSAVTYTIWARPASVQGKDDEKRDERVESAIEKLSTILGLEEEEVRESVTKDMQLVKVAKYIDKDVADKVRAEEIPGIEIAEDVKRYYPMGAFASHLLGSVTDENKGLAGIEMYYNNYLSGLPGRWIKATDNDGKGLAYGTEKYYQAENGLNLVLTIDEVIQHYTEKALEEVKSKSQAERVECIVMDPKTGDILAMAALPEYDPNNPRVPLDSKEAAYVESLQSDEEKIKYWNQMWRNPLVSDVYEPGSTFKLLTTAIALEEGLTSVNETFNCTGTIKVADRVIKCWRSHNPHGLQTLTQAVGNSCNPVFVQLAQRIGKEKYFEYMDLFGITERTGIDFPGEGYAILQNKDTAGPVELSTMSFGQGIAVTPVQLITAISALGNGGELMQPRIVKEMTNEDGTVVESYDKKLVRRIISKQTADEMCKIMEAVVDEGGSAGMKTDGYRIGGKTGTAQKVENGKYSDTKYIPSSLAMAPMDDPRLTVLLVVDSPVGDYYGSLVALPGSRVVLEESLKYLNVKPNYTQEQLQELQKTMVTVPSVTGLTVSQAKAELAKIKLSCLIMPKSAENEDFTIVDQFPKAGEKIQENAAVCLYKE